MASLFPLKRDSIPKDSQKTPTTPRKKEKTQKLINIYSENPDNPNILFFNPIKKINEGDFFMVYLICRNTNSKIDLNENMNDIIRRNFLNNKNNSIKKSFNENNFCDCQNHSALKVSKIPISDHREIKILSSLKNQRNFIQIKNAFSFQKIQFIETEFYNLNSLKDLIDFIYFKKKMYFSNNLIKFIIRNVLNCLIFLEKKKIYHCDISPSNIFLDFRNENLNIKNYKFKNSENFVEIVEYMNYLQNNKKFYDSSNNFKNGELRVILGDFNISIFSNDKFEYEGTSKYSSLETINKKYSFNSDLFSVMLIWLELKEGIELPSNGKLWHKLRKGEFKTERLNEKEKKFLMKFFNGKKYPTKIEFLKILRE